MCKYETDYGFGLVLFNLIVSLLLFCIVGVFFFLCMKALFYLPLGCK